MFFRRQKGSALGKAALAAGLFLTTACGLKVGEKPSENSNLAVGGGEKFSCMGQIGETLSSYIGAQMSEPEVNEFVDCIAYSFSSFETYTSGQNRSGYRPEELREFLQAHFLGERLISDELLYAFMDLKVTLLGGASDFLTREELRKGIELIQSLRPIALRLRPLMPVINVNVGEPRWEQLRHEASLEQVKTELLWASNQLGDLLDGSAGRYSLDSFETLMSEFRRFVNWEEHFEDTRPPQQWIELLRVLKSLVVRPPESHIEPSDWRPLLDVAAISYVQFLRFRYQVVKLPLLHGEGLREINALFEDSFNLVDMAIQRHPNRVIEISEIDRLFETLGHLSLLPFGLQSESLQAIARPLLGRVFGDIQIHPDERQLRGLNRYALAQAQAEFSRWSDIQNFLDRHFQPGIHGGSGAAPLWNSEPHPLMPTEVFRSYSQDIERITNEIRPLFKESEKNVFLVEENRLAQYNVTHSFHNLSIMNLIRAAVGLAIRGYATHFNRSWSMDSGLSEHETQQVYDAVQPLGVDLKIMDPRSRNSGKRSFLEANLFTYIGDGINERAGAGSRGHLMIFEETMELLAFLYSGGLLSDQIYKQVTEGFDTPQGRVVCPTQGLGVHGNPRIERQCLRDHFLDLMRMNNDNMPELSRYIEGLSQERKSELGRFLMDTAFTPHQSDPDYAERSEISIMVMVTHYSESVMTRYNRNLDGILDTEEAWLAYPTFRGFIEKMLRSQCISYDEGRLRDVFRYIISYGEIPEASIWTWFDFVWSSMFWEANLDRGRVIEVFSSVIRSVIQGGQHAPENATGSPQMTSAACN